MAKLNVDSIFKAIEIAGGARELSIKIGASYQSVLDWKNQRRVPSTANCQKIEKATDGQVKAEDILPDYPWEELR